MTKNKKAIKWFAEFNRAFYEIEEMLFREAYNKKNDNWLLTRSNSKIARKQETDVIKEFAEYATSQGSQNAWTYYKHITNATYKALGLLVNKKPALRDTLKTFELYEISLAESLIRRKLKEYMKLGREYHDIFQSLKKDLEEFHTTAKLLKN
jgi:hypothetical protein